MSYQIDAVNVNTRTDWRHGRRPGRPQGKREEQFPGIPERFGVTGLTMPPDIEVFGFLDSEQLDRDSVVADLHSQFATYEAMLGDQAVHSITIHGQAFADVQLEVFQPAPAGLQHADDGGVTPGSIKCRWPVRFVWRQLRGAS